MTAGNIAAALGGRRAGRWWSCRCPAHDDRSPSLSLRDGDRDLIVRCWAGCDPRDVLAELRRRGLLGGSGDSDNGRPASAVVRHEDHSDGTVRRIAMAHRIWNAAREARGTPVAAYLASRGITIPVPPSLRWAPRCWHREACAELPTMLARIDGPDGEFVGVHRTYLRRNAVERWERRDRASLGPIRGGAVRLAEAAEPLMVGEGVETCLAVMQATAQPAWAALSTSGLVALALPPIVRHVIILADHDVSGAGERAARIAADRWLAEGRRVRIAMPPEPGTDFNDVLIGRAYAEVRDVAA